MESENTVTTQKDSNKKRVFIIISALALVILCVTVVVTYYEVGPDLRCNLPSDGSAGEGWSAHRISSSGNQRCYFVYYPPNLDRDQPVPIVFSFHGFLSNPNSHALITSWHKLADEERFIVVYPQGTHFPQRWDSGATWGASNIDDVQFFLDMLEDMSTKVSIDPTRVYVNGFSNGGGMTVRLGCDAADKIAAIGSVAGAVVDTDNCNPSRPVPAIAFHGTSDPVVNYDGFGMQFPILRTGARFTNAPTYFLGAEDWTARWAEWNNCNITPNTIPLEGDVSGIRYIDCDEGADVILYTIDEGGHTWPGGWPIPFVGKTSKQIDATRKIWEFYQSYQLEIP